MTWRILTYSFVCVLAALLAWATWAGREPAEPVAATAQHASPDAHARKLVMQYCESCHGGGRTTFDFNQESLEPDAMRRQSDAWQLAVQKLRDKKMPPRSSTQPTDAERQLLIDWLERVSASDANAGRLVARRLQQAEYVNLASDLLGIRMTETVELPIDDSAWETCNDLPALSPDHLDQYRSIARHILDEAFAADCPDALDSDEMDDAGATFETSRQSRWPLAGITGNAESGAVRDILDSFARRAYRGNVDAEELDRLAAVFEDACASGAGFDASMMAALEEVLTSPHFLYRIETRTPKVAADEPPSLCSEVELASRLSFFLWSSAPDEELLAQAQLGTLRQDLDVQVKRMLRDPRTKALAKHFADVWLGLSRLDASPLDDQLRRAMKKETRMFLAAVIREDRSVLDLVLADFTFINEPLARHYGIAGVEGDKFRRVELAGTGRGGLLTHGSFLTLTSKVGNTQVVRGKWILENFLNESIADPPPEVSGARDETAQPGGNRLQIKTCAQCHQKMDPIGDTLEAFDALGRWCSMHGDSSIKPEGVLPTGEILHGPEDLKAYVATNHEALVCALSTKLLRYARGRSLSDRDKQALAEIPARVARQDFRFSQLILEVVRCTPFQSGATLPADAD